MSGGGSPRGLRIALALLLAAAPVRAQIPEYQAKAEFLERFTRFVDWPEEALPKDPAAPFLIGVLGRDPFGRHLDDLAASRQIKGRPVQVRRGETLDELRGCPLVFIAASERRALPRILARTAEHPVLTVGDSPGFAEAGVLINLYTSEEHIGFEVNEAAIKRSGLTVSSKLLRMAHPAGDH